MVVELNDNLPDLRAQGPVRPARACKKVCMQEYTDIVVGSMDIKSLFPNCKLKESKGLGPRTSGA